jgi:hypothetical protein
MIYPSDLSIFNVVVFATVSLVLYQQILLEGVTDRDMSRLLFVVLFGAVGSTTDESLAKLLGVTAGVLVMLDNLDEKKLLFFGYGSHVRQ